jgi:hypothetical protein
MNQYQMQIQLELTRAAASIAAVCTFFRLHRPEALWRRIVLYPRTRYKKD